MTVTEFDYQDYFNEHCKPLLDKLETVCTRGSIPFFYTACVKNTPADSVYVSDDVMTGSTGIVLTDDRLQKHLLINCGFDAVPHRHDLEIMMDSPDEQ